MPELQSADAQDQPGSEDIPLLVRELREAVGKTQGQLAVELSAYGKHVSRGGINRIERGHAALGKELAVALDSYAKEKELGTYRFASLVGHLKAHAIDRTRGTDLSRLLASGDLEKLYIVLCDESDLATHVRSALPVSELQIVLVIPSEQRVAELFSACSSNAGGERVEVFAGYADRLRRHMSAQVHRFQRLAGYSPGVTVDIFESDAVLNSVIVTRANNGPKCIYWPCTPVAVGQHIPDLPSAVAGADVGAWYENFIMSITSQNSDVARAQHLGDTFLMFSTRESDKATRPDQEARVRLIDEVRFSRFLRRSKLSEYKLDSDEGLAVVAIMLFVPTYSQGRHAINVLVKRRSRILAGAESDVDGQLAFVSARVTAPALWKALRDHVPQADVSGEQQRAHRAVGHLDPARHLLEQSAMTGREFDNLVGSLQPAEWRMHYDRVIEDAYKNAAVAELEMSYGFESRRIPLKERLQPSDLPAFVLNKEQGNNLVPRLFTLGLTPKEADLLVEGASRYDGNEVVRIRIGEDINYGEPLTHGGSRDGDRERRPFDDILDVVMTEDLLRPGFAKVLESIESDCDPSGGSLALK